VLPKLRSAVALDLDLAFRITDIDVAMHEHTWHWVRDRILRLLDSETESWTKKAVMALVRSRSDRLPAADGRDAGIHGGGSSG
jgi:hypothetical protein